MLMMIVMVVMTRLGVETPKDELTPAMAEVTEPAPDYAYVRVYGDMGMMRY
jgi:hypothetical protein